MANTAQSGKSTAKQAPKIGAKIRRLRREQGLTQAQLAERLGVSASYLNLIEHNRRKLTTDLLLGIAEQFKLDFASLAEDDESRLYNDVMDAFGDRLFEEVELTNTDVRELVTASPQAARALLTLYDAYYKTLNDARSLAAQMTDGEEDGGGFGIGGFALADLAPADLISDMIQENQNHFADLEHEADRVRREVKMVGDTVGHDTAALSWERMADYLREAHGVRTVFATPEPTPGTGGEAGTGTGGIARRFDKRDRALTISARLDAQARAFQLAHQIGQLSADPVLEMLLTENRIKQEQGRALGRVALANYFAAALLMPYEEVLGAARATRYDIELLQHQFNASFEQVCHRLTSLTRPGDAGIPLHMLRVDTAGNISKRFTLSGLPIPRHGGACARWNVYSAFLNPGVIQAQVSKLPEGQAYFCIARTVRKGGVGHGARSYFQSIGIGCDLRYAREMVYSDDVELDRPERFGEIGVACRICERMDCGQRAFPPVHLRYTVDPDLRGASPYTAPGWPWHHERPGPTR
ncbi:DUF2083 domain-containing protein [Marivibrio halodurans]|uniref:DUF2083 domain-containing protein n=1 Tax=Marivibrio halodurans TaxID=2039722 RepID=A0A8J7V4R6_9PROT|nr:helix-turn-helix transcriptional regulator [Marivibrio halodurans]MBP5857974.1 DUF2083 domain-containing protein [Marivibrio halodurans]